MAEPVAMIPLYGFLQGDTLGLVVLAAAHENMHVVAMRLLASAAIRTPPSPHLRVLYEGRAVALSDTVASLNARPLDRIDVLRTEEP